MSIAPVCPRCGAFAPWIVSEGDVRSDDRKGWPREETIIGGSIIRKCVNGHSFSERAMMAAMAKAGLAQ